MISSHILRPIRGSVLYKVIQVVKAFIFVIFPFIKVFPPEWSIQNKLLIRACVSKYLRINGLAFFTVYAESGVRKCLKPLYIDLLSAKCTLAVCSVPPFSKCIMYLLKQVLFMDPYRIVKFN
jgi:hypothetical protein